MIRTILRALIKGVMGFVTIIILSMTFAPVTVAEAANIGPNPDRFDLTQIRLARAMMDVAPDLTVAAYAKVTGAPAALIRENLNRKAAGGTFVAELDFGAKRSAQFIKVDE